MKPSFRIARTRMIRLLLRCLCCLSFQIHACACCGLHAVTVMLQGHAEALIKHCILCVGPLLLCFICFHLEVYQSTRDLQPLLLRPAKHAGSSIVAATVQMLWQQHPHPPCVGALQERVTCPACTHGLLASCTCRLEQACLKAYSEGLVGCSKYHSKLMLYKQAHACQGAMQHHR